MESISQDVITFSTSLNINPSVSLDLKCDLPQHNNSVPYNAGHSRTPSNALSEPISDIGEMNKLLFNSIVEDQPKSTDSVRYSLLLIHIYRFLKISHIDHPVVSWDRISTTPCRSVQSLFCK